MIVGSHLMIEDDILTVTASFGKSLISLMNLDGNKVFAFQAPPFEYPKTLRNAESLNSPGLATSRLQIIEFTAGKPPFSKV